ncbi:hypothetical protein CANARDRAFT_30688 [[Candida] arabinofermentans NRRL YB-2248]|uniref:Protein SIP5 n=1 Tax=[Candida] arabinofermentans NRRL YB-2248 TaxID=983967 RepID=A0A1E4ST39_9ASCO|nr:hypothetical protein CANARDRAFT_30688 [[Candida] arabinofermentans NRRL YB-2248]
MGNTPTKELRPSRSGSFSRDLLVSPKSLSGLSRKKKEKEIDKQKQREQQMLQMIVRYDENIDGGYLAPYESYKFSLSYKTQIVRQLIIERKLAPFFTPLQDFDENWTDKELLEYLRKLPLHADISMEDLDDDEEDPDDHKIHQSVNSIKRKESKLMKRKLKEAAVKLQTQASIRYQKDRAIQLGGIKTFENIPSDDLLLRLYRNSAECPICFLYYPLNLNVSRCCIQPICTECFVQMKRSDPHPPHDEGGGGDSSNPNNNDNLNPEDLISEPVKCPFCAMSDFGVTYTPPNFRSGIDGRPPSEFRDFNATIEEEPDLSMSSEGGGGTAAINISNSFTQNHRSSLSYAMSKSHSAQGTPPRHSGSFIDNSGLTTTISSSMDQQNNTSTNNNNNTTNNNNNNQLLPPARKRRGSLPPTAPGVITIDFIRPDWEQKLLNARTKLARRSAAATALHASSLISNRGGSGSGDLSNNNSLTISGSVRGGLMSGSNLYDLTTSTPSNDRRHRSLVGSSRYSRQDQLEIEERMIEQALKLSLLDEEERRLKERATGGK